MLNMEKYQNLVVYWFSGTGNARFAAQTAINTAKQRGLTTHMICIDRFEKVEIPELWGKTLIGFFAPTHGFNLPPNMLEYICLFPRKKINADVFILNTRAGMKFLKVFLPGLSGLAQYFAALVLRLKGYRIVGQQPLDMPSNWISLHPGVRQKVSESIHERCERITKKATNKLLDGQKIRKAWLSLPFDLAIMPVSLGYYFFGRFMIAKTFVATNKCSKCGLCLKQCPVKAIIEVDQRMFWKHTCESCMRCMNNCPERAVETAHGFTFGTSVLGGFLFSYLVSLALTKLNLFDHSDQLVIYLIDYLLFPALILATFIASYRFIHFLMRYKVFNFLIEYTSFTKLKLWRRYKAKRIF
jgi:ferredoxin